jgi:HSP20 family molecular chaperone IbpA
MFTEFESSNYFRQFELADSVDQENIEAELKKGVLSLFLPKAEELKPRNIEVKVS